MTDKTVASICPECDTKIRFNEGPGLGAFVRCPECNTTLEVVRTAPLKLGWAFEEPFDEEEGYRVRRRN
ncbi:MAG: lysine biosynthesis protein LysW [Chloroflexi bacterium]|nr:lysine biosynthesis protein LysW [Chloroflexota bacterium]MCI0578398.1 lysine biosynthesis protein LysW [Chloroflexota bacterium]MCI0647605.1 lysine biosynthesis protein LysW [Chloroflexota bacterium]MCI0730426.1 lysine biosynthesis protein LysW [Chloroflexota bacterium]